MKKIILLVGLTAMLVLGAGCTQNYTGVKPLFNPLQPSVTSTVPPLELSTAIEVGVSDFAEIESKIKQGKKIVEVEDTSVPPLALPSGILKEQIWKYFRLDDMYFMVYIRRNSNFFMNMPEEAIESGILWGRKSDTKWRTFFVVRDKNESSKDSKYFNPPDQNNILYFWTQDKKIHFIAQDVHGGGSGEGIGKIISSTDGGKTWRVDRCFSMEMGGKDSSTSTMSTASQQFIFQNYINRKFNKNTEQNKKDFDFNSSTGKFGFTQFDPQQNKNSIHEVDDCQNIFLP